MFNMSTNAEQKKLNKVPIFILVAVLIAGTFAVVFSRSINSEDIVPKVDVNNLEVIKEKVPAIDDSKGWLNTDGISQAKLNKSVVIYDFWTYSCINCQRTLPYLRAIYDRYKDDGLIIVGIHSPEFDFEKIHSNVENAVKKYKVNWPVLFDDSMKNWDNFENQYWPAKYITDKQGRIRYSHFGEGRYEETEDVVRKLLDIDKDAPRADLPGKKKDELTRGITPELYLNPIRGVSNAKAGKQVISEEVKPELNGVTYFGAVNAQAEKTILSKDAKLFLNFKAGEVNIVVENTSDDIKVAKLKVELDGKPIPESIRGEEIKVDDQGNTYIDVSDPDLSHILKSNKIEQGILSFTALDSNIAAYSFTFGA